MESSITCALRDAEMRYAQLHPHSASMYEFARKQFPGGNTRSAVFYTPFPIAWARGDANRLVDVDGLSYLDFLGEYSAGLYGHNNAIILEAIQRAARDGLSLGGPNVYEAKLAAAIRGRFPSIDLIRFTNSGTEANLMALATVRALDSARQEILVFDGAYHGGVLSFRGKSNPLNIPFDWVIAPFNDIGATQAMIRQHAPRLCAVLIEPMQGGGCVVAERAFLEMLRAECTRFEIALIFDEVMTSRLSAGGLQELFGIRPDLTTLGKYLGGGLSFGAFGGARTIMRRFDPLDADAFVHAGTFNNNVLSMAAGYAGLTKVFTPEAAVTLNGTGDYLRDAVNVMAVQKGYPVRATGVGSLVGLHFDRNCAFRSSAGTTQDDELGAVESLVHIEMLNRGFYYGRRGYLALSIPTSQADCDSFVHALMDVCATHRDVLKALVG